MLFSTIQKSINELEKYKDIAKNLENEPEIIFNELFKNKHKDILYLSIQSHENLLDLQEYLFKISEKYIKNKFSDVKIHYNNSIFPSTIVIAKDDIDLCELDIYNREIFRIENKELLELQNKQDEITATIKKKNEKLNNLAKIKENIYLLANNNPAQMMKIWLQEKYYRNKINNEYKNLYMEIMQLEKEIISIDAKIKKVQDDLIELKYLQDKILNYFKEKFKYIITNKK